MSTGEIEILPWYGNTFGISTIALFDSCIRFSVDSKFLLVEINDCKGVELWNVEQKKHQVLIKKGDHIEYIGFSPKGDYIFINTSSFSLFDFFIWRRVEEK